MNDKAFINFHIYPESQAAVIQLCNSSRCQNLFQTLVDTIGFNLDGLEDSAISAIPSLDQVLFSFRWEERITAESVEESIKTYISSVFFPNFPCHVNNQRSNKQ